MKTPKIHELRNARARDLMHRDLATLAADETIHAALETLEEARVNGAPVVDGTGRLVGVFSRSDVATSDHVRENHVEERPGQREFPDLDPESDDFDLEDALASKEDYSPELLGRELVGDWMTRGAISVTPDALLSEVCRAMVEHGIHRVFVCEGQRPVGVISALDVVRALAESLQPATPETSSAPRAPRASTAAARRRR